MTKQLFPTDCVPTFQFSFATSALTIPHIKGNEMGKE